MSDSGISAPRRRRRRRVGLARRAGPWLGSMLVGAALLASALSLGGQGGLGLIIPCALAMIAAADAFRHGIATPRAAWACFLLATFCAVQALPLPLGWLQNLTPASFEVWSRSLRAFGAGPPEFGALSVDPGASWVEALKWSSYGYLFVACCALRSRLGATWLATLVFGSGVLLACVTLVHGAFDIEALYGFYEPTFAVERWSRGPLLNSNNLAGYANLALFSGVAVWLSPRRHLPSWVLTAGGVSLLAVVLLSGSRAGVGSLVLGALILAGWLTIQRRGGMGKKVGIASVVAIAACFMLARVADERVYQALVSTDIVQKVSAWRAALDMVRDYWAFGAGRGAFESAFASYQRPAAGGFPSIVSHAENFPVQFVSEWGVLVGGLALLLGAWLLARASFRNRREPVQAALATGIGVVLLQNLADLGLEITALTMALVVVASGLSRRMDPPAGRSLAASGARVLPGLALLGIALAPAHHRVQIDREALVARFERSRAELHGDVDGLRRDLEQATRRHPAEPYFAYLTALIAHRQRDANPMPAIQRALERSPYHGATHLLLAHVLARKGARGQALLHLRLAATYDRGLASVVIDRALRWAKDGDELVRALPPDKNMVSAACKRLPPGERAIACWKGYAALDPSDYAAEVWLAGAWLDLLERTAEPCATSPAACERAVERSLGVLRARRVADALLLGARLKAVRGQAREAALELFTACPVTAAGLPCHELVLELAQRGRVDELLVKAVERWLPLACAGRAECSEQQARAGRLLAGAGAPALALSRLTEAARSSPSVARWLEVAALALATRNLPSARVALDRAKQLGPVSEEERARLSELESRLLQDSP